MRQKVILLDRHREDNQDSLMWPVCLVEWHRVVAVMLFSSLALCCLRICGVSLEKSLLSMNPCLSGLKFLQVYLRQHKSPSLIPSLSFGLVLWWCVIPKLFRLFSRSGWDDAKTTRDEEGTQWAKLSDARIQLLSRQVIHCGVDVAQTWFRYRAGPTT